MSITEADAFDLPDWVGTEATWAARDSVRAGGHVGGTLSHGADQLQCDLLAADHCYPKAVLEDRWRTAAHRAWQYGEVLLLDVDDVLTVVVPGTGFTPDLVVEALSRLGKAVGLAPASLGILLRP